MPKSVLIVLAHPEPRSLNAALAAAAAETLQAQNHRVMVSDLYAMGFHAVAGGQDFRDRADPGKLNLITESGHAYASGTQAGDIAAEQQKILSADALILQFPLWWFSPPAILKGWIERVWAYGLAYGFQGKGNTHRYGEGGLSGKRALVSVTTGGPEADFGPRGINGPLNEILFPLLHGSLFYPGMEVLPLHAIHGANRLTTEDWPALKTQWQQRVTGLFEDKPIAFRKQNGGDYPDRHTLAEDIAPEKTGLLAHIRD